MDLSGKHDVMAHSHSEVIEIGVSVFDEEGRSFSNFSSLRFAWTVSPSELGELGSQDGVFMRENLDIGNRSYQTVTLKGQTGVLEV